ncbi:hypothetical protein Sango_2421700 [Sesamum angolense]|uniref:Reverse transcriptase domain-containing protein n=1 Tax=Sesamum angolense TaxID=2727404 RepID=A0AAE1W7H5_9LAMI|nr:hypothetical protein Sango_2421700 [Sesamum angolense]
MEFLILNLCGYFDSQAALHIVWGPDVRCQVLNDHEQLLDVQLESNKWPKLLFVTAVYAKCDTVERCALWDALRVVSVGASPWIVGGDFSTVLSLDERSGDLAPSGIAMSDFHDAITDSTLIDARYLGSPYTWYSRRLHQHLDRVHISSCWITVFPKMQVTHLELSQSDHRDLLVEAGCTVERKVSSFCFQHMWTMHSEFLGVVRRNWQYPTVGSSMMRLQQKLTRLKHCLEEWNKTVFGNVFDKVAAAERRLKEADDAYDQDPCDRTLVERNRCSAELVRGFGPGGDFLERLLTAEPVFLEEMDSEHLEDGLTDEDRRSLCVMLTLDDSEFFRGVEMPKGFTATTISLIPNMASLTCWSECRPISLCNVTNKICTKLMTIQLGHVLPKVISLSQNGFVPGQLLSDNVLLAQELVHSLESRRPKANVLFKLDMAKAYDRFVLAADYLSRGLDRLFAAYPAMYYQAPGRIRVSHLAYADDLMIFTTTCRRNMELPCDFLQAYEQGSYNGRKHIHWSSWAKACFSVAEGGLGVRILADYVRTFSMKLWMWFWSKSSLWSEYLHGRYCQNLHPTIVSYNRDHSRVWHRLCRIRDVAEPFLFRTLGEGFVSFWHDNWLGEKPLAQLLLRNTYTMELMSYYWHEGD